MALNYLVDTLLDSECVIDQKQERPSTFGDQSSFDDHLKGCRIESTQKENDTLYDTTRRGDRRKQRSRILDSNSEPIHRTETRNTLYRLMLCQGETTFQTKDAGRRRRKKTMKRSKSIERLSYNRISNKIHGLVILIMLTKRRRERTNDMI